RAIACSATTRFSLEEDQIPAAANSRASAFKQCRSFHLIPLKAYAAASCLPHAIALREESGQSHSTSKKLMQLAGANAVTPHENSAILSQFVI
ncbi:MAG: hypothetical protein V2B19_11530, partial [Pseudomonadota bacterium]